MKTLKINVDELWSNTHLYGRSHSNRRMLRLLGSSHVVTADLFNFGCELPVEEYPTSRFLLSDDYGTFTGRQKAGENFCKLYLKWFKLYFESIKKLGYDIKKSMMTVDVINDKIFLSDGNRRIASIVALGKQREITVKVDDLELWHEKALGFAEKCLSKSYLCSLGKKVLYQPILYEPFKEYTTKPMKTMYQQALSIIVDSCQNIEGKTFLDVGCCYGYFSFGLAEHGALVTGVETDGTRRVLATNLARLYHLDWSNPKFIRMSIEQYIEHTKLHYDYILMLNVFHYLYRANEEKAWQTLNILAEKSDTILLTMSHASENIGSQKDISSLILNNSILAKCKDLGPIPPFDRHLFIFNR